MLETLSEYTSDGLLFPIIITTSILLSIVSLLLFISKLSQIFRRETLNTDVIQTNPDDDNMAIVVKGGYIDFKGKKLKYFILKDNMNKSEKLTIGTKVLVMKKSQTEAYVKPM